MNIQGFSANRGARNQGRPMDWPDRLTIRGRITDDTRVLCRNFIEHTLGDAQQISRSAQRRAQSVASELLSNIVLHSKHADGERASNPVGVIEVSIDERGVLVQAEAPVIGDDFNEIQGLIDKYKRMSPQYRATYESELVAKATGDNDRAGSGLGLLIVVNDSKEVEVDSEPTSVDGGYVNCRIRARI